MKYSQGNQNSVFRNSDLIFLISFSSIDILCSYYKDFCQINNCVHNFNIEFFYVYVYKMKDKYEN